MNGVLMAQGCTMDAKQFERTSAEVAEKLDLYPDGHTEAQRATTEYVKDASQGVVPSCHGYE